MGLGLSITDEITQEAGVYGVDPTLALHVAQAESGVNQNAVSPKGAIGVFQLMPATAASLGVNPADVAQNIQGGVEYLSQMLSRFGGDVQKALAAYDWGPGNVASAIAQWGDAWLDHVPSETYNYVTAIVGKVGSSLTDLADSIPSPFSDVYYPDGSVPDVVTYGVLILAAAVVLRMVL